MCFLLAGVIDKFHYLKVVLAFVLMFVGVKMTIVDWVKISVLISLLVVAVILGGSVIAWLIVARRVEVEQQLQIGWRVARRSRALECGASAPICFTSAAADR